MDVDDKLKLLLDEIPAQLNPISELCKKYLYNGSKLNEGGNLRILHRPWVAPYNWAFMLYRGVEEKWYRKFSDKTGKYIPEFLCTFLTHINGCHIHNFSIFGINPQTLELNLVNRVENAPFDLVRANTSWINEFDIETSFLYFGSRTYNTGEKLGYFIDGNAQIFSKLRGGEVIDYWDNFQQFLLEELEIVEMAMLESIPEGQKLNLNN